MDKVRLADTARPIQPAEKVMTKKAAMSMGRSRRMRGGKGTRNWTVVSMMRGIIRYTRVLRMPSSMVGGRTVARLFVRKFGYLMSISVMNAL